MKNLPVFLFSIPNLQTKNLINKIGIYPDEVIDFTNINKPSKGELPNQFIKKILIKKSNSIALNIGYTIVLYTISCVGRRILSTPTNNDEVYNNLKLISGRRHRVYTGICINKKDENETKQKIKLVNTIVKVKRFSEQEINHYIKNNYGINKNGIIGLGYEEQFILSINGSYSNLQGLPLYETKNMFLSLGFNFY